MRKIFILSIFVGSLLLVALFIPQVKINDKVEIIYIQEKNLNKIANQLQAKNCLSYPIFFKFLAYFFIDEDKIKIGKYSFQNNDNTFTIIRNFRNNYFSNINFVIIKYRTKNDFAKDLSKHFNITYAHVLKFISNNDSLKNYGVDSNNFFSMIIPNTYTLNWNASLKTILNKIHAYSKKFKDNNPIENRIARNLNLDYKQMYILASIVEEESNVNEDKKLIASVYLNRLKINMPLQADPTIKYALGDFTLKRIYKKYLKVPSSYNTYIHKNLPIGPICTPSENTLKIVLNAPMSSFLFFVSKADFSGSHNFSKNYAEHLRQVKIYHQFLNKLAK